MKKNQIMYEKIVENNTDLIGFVAYSFYKKEQIEYIRTENPSADMLNEHQKIYSDGKRIKLLREEAGLFLNKFINNIININNIKPPKQITKKQMEESVSTESIKDKTDRRLKIGFGIIFTFFTIVFTFISYAIIILNYQKHIGIPDYIIAGLVVKIPFEFIGILYIITRHLYPTK